jgi:hypothetical protein
MHGIQIKKCGDLQQVSSHSTCTLGSIHRISSSSRSGYVFLASLGHPKPCEKMELQGLPLLSASSQLHFDCTIHFEVLVASNACRPKKCSQLGILNLHAHIQELLRANLKYMSCGPEWLKV